MTKALILLGRDLSTAKLEQFFQEDDPTHHKAGPICFKGKAGWDTRLATYAGSLEQLNTAFNQDGDMPSAVATRLMYVVQCPRCDRQSPSNDYKFQYEDLGLKIKCTECSKFSCIAKWKCNCGVLWHTCKVHHCAEKVKPKAKDKLASDSGITGGRKMTNKRSLENASYDELLDDDLRIQAKRDKKNWMEDNKLGTNSDPSNKSEIRLTSSMLPLSLRLKFASLELPS